MSDLTLDQLKKAYDAALEQIAAESILDPTFDNDQIILRLQLGNNPPTFPATDPDLLGKLRMTLGQAQDFAARYDIIDAYQNDATGFSAVALRDTDNPGRVVIAVRSTEINNDTARDLGADAQIFTTGFAFDQILSAQDFLLRVQPQLLLGETIDLVGYSLSGNVVRTLAAMYPGVVNTDSGSNVVFNATGLGGFSDPTGQNRPRSVVLQEMMDLYRQVEADPNSVTDVPLLLQPLQLTAIAAAPIDRTNPNGNVYPSPRNDFAEAYIQNKYTTFYNDFGTTVAEPSFAQYFGVPLSGLDTAVVSNSGSHPVPIGISIEGQPIVEAPGVADRFDYLNTHSLILLADSLRVQMVFKELDPNLSTDAIQSIFQAASAASASTLTQTAEGDTLEKTLDGLRTLFLGPTLDPLTLPSSNAPGSFGNIANRTAFYNNITTIESVVSTSGTFQIVPFVMRDPNDVTDVIPAVTAAELKTAAQDPGDSGLAYRYALRTLNPFAIIGVDYAGLGHASNGVLALEDPATGFGEMTDQYLTDRAAFLLAKLDLTLNNQTRPSDLLAVTHYQDMASGIGVPAAVVIPAFSQREYLFGGADPDTLSGHDLTNDHLYGSLGNDILRGFGSDDYLQGDSGNDWLDAAGGSDRLNGGLGFDTYVLNADGTDTITDGDDRGRLLVNGQLLSSGLRRAGDDPNTYHSTDNVFTFVQSGTTLTINGQLTVTNWQPGDLGVTLRDLSALPTGTAPVIDYNNGYSTEVVNLSPGPVEFNGSGQWLAQFDGPTNYVVQGNYGPETILGDGTHTTFYAQNQQIAGGAGSDQITGDFQDRLYGEGGDDLIRANWGADVVYGGAGRDLIFGDLNYFAQVPAGTYDDYVDGGSEQDTLSGMAGNDTVLGGTGDDELYGDDYSAYTQRPEGNDYLNGGDGDDRVYADWATTRCTGASGTIDCMETISPVAKTITCGPSDPG